MDRGAWWATVHGVAESDTTEATKYVPMSNFQAHFGHLRTFVSLLIYHETLKAGSICLVSGMLSHIKQTLNNICL